MEAAVDATIAKLLADGVTDEEMARAKSGMIAAATYARDSVRRTARIFGGALVIGLTAEDVETWPERVEAVTAEQVLAAARHVLDLRRSVTGLLLPGEEG